MASGDDDLNKYRDRADERRKGHNPDYADKLNQVENHPYESRSLATYANAVEHAVLPSDIKWHRRVAACFMLLLLLLLLLLLFAVVVGGGVGGDGGDGCGGGDAAAGGGAVLPLVLCGVLFCLPVEAHHACPAQIYSDGLHGRRDDQVPRW